VSMASGKDTRLRSKDMRGLAVIRDNTISKGQAFTIEERMVLGIHGLLAPAVRTPEDQVKMVLKNLKHWESALDKYIYLMGLQDRNERLFYRVIIENVETMMPIIYTPTVGLACQKYGLIFRKARGLFITIHDKGHIYDVICNWPETDVAAVCVTDGERILGLGDLGSYGMGIPVGKLALYTACAGIKPHQCLPITLDVGTNNDKLLDESVYIGLRQRRISGVEYDEFIDEFMSAIVSRYGQDVLIQFEDFGNANAFRFLAKYKNKYCTFNDDIQGTAGVTLSGLISSMRITGQSLKQQTVLFQGAGEAAIGIANLIVMAMEDEGSTTEEALSRIWMVDTRGLIVKDRPKGGITEHKARFAKDHEPVDSLADVVKTIKPTAIIGVAAVPGAFTEDIIRDMAAFNKQPIIFALSNPTSKAECTAEQAYTLTEGHCIFASGSPFDAVTLGDVTYHPGQGNNAYIFPGVALAVMACKMRHIPDTVFLRAAQRLASIVTDKDLSEGRVYPPLSDIRAVSIAIATDLVEFAYKNKIAFLYPEPEDKAAFIKSMLYSTEYESFLPEVYNWPENSKI